MLIRIEIASWIHTNAIVFTFLFVPFLYSYTLCSISIGFFARRRVLLVSLHEQFSNDKNRREKNQ